MVVLGLVLVAVPCVLDDGIVLIDGFKRLRAARTIKGITQLHARRMLVNEQSAKGIAEASVRYVKHNALQGRAEELSCWEGYAHFASYWLREVANVRLHHTTKERPVDRLEKERDQLRSRPKLPLDTDEIVSAVVTPHARIKFDGNRYSVPPDLARKTVMIRASEDTLRLFHQGSEIARHDRCYERGQLLIQATHQLEALKKRQRVRAHHVEEMFDTLGPAAQAFHLQLRQRPVKTIVHLRRLLHLVRLYGRQEVLAAIDRALEYQTYDAAYVETILRQERRRRELPSPTPVRPRRPELVEEIELEEPDPGLYDRFCESHGNDPENPTDE